MAKQHDISLSEDDSNEEMVGSTTNAKKPRNKKSKEKAKRELKAALKQY